MASYVMVTIEGVLARSSDSVLIGSPIPEGVALYGALRRGYKIVLATGEPDEDKVEHWLGRHGITGYTMITYPPVRLDPPVRTREEQLLSLRSAGWPVDLLVDSSPAVIAMALRNGVTGLLFASPVYARPEFRPDASTSLREWDAIAAEVDEQNRLRAREPLVTADLEG